ncbi:MAG: hypothetical protein ACPGUD_13045 [Parashewanella sp.]
MHTLLAQMDLVLKAVEVNPTAAEKDCALTLMAIIVEQRKQELNEG